MRDANSLDSRNSFARRISRSGDLWKFREGGAGEERRSGRSGGKIDIAHGGIRIADVNYYARRFGKLSYRVARV